MSASHRGGVLRSLLTLALLSFALGISLLSPGAGQGRTVCSDHDVYDFCWSQGRNVDPNTCDCNPNSCLGVPESDCTEQGGWLDYGTCTCRLDYGYVGMCDIDPYAYGCPRNPGGLGDPGRLCSFDGYVNCRENRGAWDDWTCSCYYITTSNTCGAELSNVQSCEAAGGTWNQDQCRCLYP
jgi:hypothetical protein